MLHVLPHLSRAFHRILSVRYFLVDVHAGCSYSAVCSDRHVLLVLLQDAKRIMPGMDITQMLRSNPDMILSLQKGKNLIPYDQIDNPWS